MSRQFNIAVCAQFAPALMHVARLFQASLQSLGHQATIKVGAFASNAENIVLGYNVTGHAEQFRDCSIIQTEQLTHGDSRYDPVWLNLLREAREIWDFSRV